MQNLNDLSQLTITDINEYGNDAQVCIAKVADEIMNNIQTRDVGAIGDQLTQLTLALRQSNHNEHDNFLTRLFNRGRDAVISHATLYNQIDDVVNNIDTTLNDQLKELTSNNQRLTTFSSNLHTYLQTLDTYVANAQKQLKQLQTTTLPAAQQAYQQDQSVTNKQHVNDINDLITAWQDRIIALQASYQVADAELTQIRISQQTNNALITKIYSNQQNIVPLWRMMSVSQLAQLQQRDIVAKNQALKTATEKMLTAGAKLTHDNAIKITEMNQQATISIDSIKQFKQTLNDTINDLIKLTDNAQQTRQQTINTLNAMKGDFHE